MFAAIQAAAPSFRVEVSRSTCATWARSRAPSQLSRSSPNGGPIVSSGAAATDHRDLIIDLAARYKLPAVYYPACVISGGGLISYGPDYVDQYRRAAGYVDRILKGEKPADLPVQAPTKFER